MLAQVMALNTDQAGLGSELQPADAPELFQLPLGRIAKVGLMAGTENGFLSLSPH